jgi:uncharacterized phiE125 gp8 family phage protein
MGTYTYNRLKRTTEPTQLPVTLATAKEHLRVDHSDDDTYITGLIWAATRTIEDYTKKAISQTTFEQYMDEWPEKYIELVIGHDKDFTLQTIKYYREDGTLQTLSSTLYTLDSSYNPARIYWNTTFSEPTRNDDKKQIIVTFLAGNDISSNAIPYPVQQALLLIIGHLYENRMAVTNTLNRELPMGVESLLDGFKIFSA